MKNVCYQHKQTRVVVKLVEERFGLSISARTIRDWVSKFKTGNWNFKDKSRIPPTIHK